MIFSTQKKSEASVLDTVDESYITNQVIRHPASNETKKYTKSFTFLYSSYAAN